MPQDKRQNAERVVAVAHTARVFDATERDDLGFTARILVQTTLPHSDPGDVREYARSNGNLHLIIQPGMRAGLPYGVYPRLVLAWVTTEAVRTKSPRLVLGDSLSAFMAELGIVPTGGRWGTITRLREQMKRLFAARVGVVYDGVDGYSLDAIQVARRVRLWWDPKRPDQAALWQSEVVLDDEFFRQIVDRPVPIDLHILKHLTRSPLGIDLYCWLTHRVSYMKTETVVPWAHLHQQFGADYNELRNFTQKAKRELRKIKLAWPELKYRTPRGRLVLSPSPTHVKRVSA